LKPQAMPLVLAMLDRFAICRRTTIVRNCRQAAIIKQ
jgi:hypothetical protein